MERTIANTSICYTTKPFKLSGSDIVVEGDLAEIFGRARIMDSVASSFRAEMSKFTPAKALYNGLCLFRGAGPTVIRALTEPVYFSMIVQCALPTSAGLNMFLTVIHGC